MMVFPFHHIQLPVCIDLKICFSIEYLEQL